MTPSYYTARANLSYLLDRHPEWTNAQFAAALGYSQSWVKKWRARLQEEQAAGMAVETTWQGHSRARKHPPTATHPLIVDLVLAIRDHPPEGLRRVPGQLAIQYYLQRDPMVTFFQMSIPSRRTIARILTEHQRIATPVKRVHEPMERPTPLSCWQIDFKDVSSVPADPQGKRQHVVETLTIIDMGTSILLDAHVRADFTAETALEALAGTLLKYGRPQRITLDRDVRLSWEVPQAVIFRPHCCALGPVWASTFRSVRLVIPNKTALSNAITAPITRSASAWIGLPPWSKRKR